MPNTVTIRRPEFETCIGAFLAIILYEIRALITFDANSGHIGVDNDQPMIYAVLNRQWPAITPGRSTQCDQLNTEMTKIDVTDPSKMTEQNLTVDDILNENLIIRKKKIDYVDEETKINNRKIDKTNMNLKRKAKFDLNEDFSLDKVAHNINISIDTETNKTIRLELRHPDNQCVVTDYKITDADDVRTVLALDSEGMNGYSLKDNIRIEDKNEDLNVRNEMNGGEFTNGNDEEDKVSF